MPLAPALTSLLSGSCCDSAKVHLAKQEQTVFPAAKAADLLLFRNKNQGHLIFII
jgi:hypothetical protein